jgi:hypothetical protein
MVYQKRVAAHFAHDDVYSCGNTTTGGMNPGCGNTTNTIVRLRSDGQVFRVRVSQYIMFVSSICICGIDFGKHHGYKP